MLVKPAKLHLRFGWTTDSQLQLVVLGTTARCKYLALRIWDVGSGAAACQGQIDEGGSHKCDPSKHVPLPSLCGGAVGTRDTSNEML